MKPSWRWSTQGLGLDLFWGYAFTFETHLGVVSKMINPPKGSFKNEIFLVVKHFWRLCQNIPRVGFHTHLGEVFLDTQTYYFCPILFLRSSLSCIEVNFRIAINISDIAVHFLNLPRKSTVQVQLKNVSPLVFNETNFILPGLTSITYSDLRWQFGRTTVKCPITTGLMPSL